MNRLPAVRERTEELERASLSTWATLAAETKGRDTLRGARPAPHGLPVGPRPHPALRGVPPPEAQEPSPARRRPPPDAGDPRAGGRADRAHDRPGLRLNEDLIEAIALGHDLGNTAFGAAGEEALTIVHARCRSAMRSRACGSSSSSRTAARGLNLTWEVRDGIVNHRADAPDAGDAGRAGGPGRRSRSPPSRTTCATRCRYGLLARRRRAGRASRRRSGDTHEDRLGSADPRRDHRVHRPARARDESARRGGASVTLPVAASRRTAAPRRDIARSSNRAVHCLSSLAIYLLQNPGVAAGSDEDPVTSVCDAVCVVHRQPGARATSAQLFLPVRLIRRGACRRRSTPSAAPA